MGEALKNRKALSLLDGVVGGPDNMAVVSFPGVHEDEWNDMVANVLLMQNLARLCGYPPEEVPKALSTACVFLPDGDPLYGQHVLNDVDFWEKARGRCFCHKLYGKLMPWGCGWFGLWRDQLEKVLELGQRPVVVYKRGEKGVGDKLTWSNFPIQFSTEHKGLGGSQKGEVAYLRKRLRGCLGDSFDEKVEKLDVDELSERILMTQSGRRRLSKSGCSLLTESVILTVMPGGGGGSVSQALSYCDAPGGSIKFVQAIKELPLKVQQAIGTLSLGSWLEDAAAVALMAVLPSLTSLRRLRFCGAQLSSAPAPAVAMALVSALPSLGALRALELSGIGLSTAGAVNLAREALPSLGVLQELCLGYEGLGGEVATALAEALPSLGALRKLVLVDWGRCTAGGVAIARALSSLGALQELRLVGGMDEEACLAIAGALPSLDVLQELELSKNDLGDEAGVALARALPRLGALRELSLNCLGLGDRTGVALAGALPHSKA